MVASFYQQKLHSGIILLIVNIKHLFPHSATTQNKNVTKMDVTKGILFIVRIFNVLQNHRIFQINCLNFIFSSTKNT